MGRLKGVEAFSSSVETIKNPTPLIFLRGVDGSKARQRREQEIFLRMKANRKVWKRPTSPITKTITSANIDQSNKSFICCPIQNCCQWNNIGNRRIIEDFFLPEIDTFPISRNSIELLGKEFKTFPARVPNSNAWRSIIRRDGSKGATLKIFHMKNFY